MSPKLLLLYFAPDTFSATNPPPQHKKAAHAKLRHPRTDPFLPPHHGAHHRRHAPRQIKILGADFLTKIRPPPNHLKIRSRDLLISHPYDTNSPNPHREQKAVARPGRKRKPGPRHPGGQLKRIIDAEKAASNVQKSVVLAQPHRRGEESQLAGCALGRFVLTHRLRREYFDAGEQWASTKRKWLSCRGAPLPDHPSGGTGGDVPIEVFDGWLKDDAQASRAMEKAAGLPGLSAVRSLAFDDADLSDAYPAFPVMKALAALAVHYGLLPASAADISAKLPAQPRQQPSKKPRATPPPARS